jgi:hypothetical protein
LIWYGLTVVSFQAKQTELVGDSFKETTSCLEQKKIGKTQTTKRKRFLAIDLDSIGDQTDKELFKFFKSCSENEKLAFSLFLPSDNQRSEDNNSNHQKGDKYVVHQGVGLNKGLMISFFWDKLTEKMRSNEVLSTQDLHDINNENNLNLTEEDMKYLAEFFVTSTGVAGANLQFNSSSDEKLEMNAQLALQCWQNRKILARLDVLEKNIRQECQTSLQKVVEEVKSAVDNHDESQPMNED